VFGNQKQQQQQQQILDEMSRKSAGNNLNVLFAV